MATVKRQRRTSPVPSTPARKLPDSKKQTLRNLYVRLEKTQPGSEASKRISRQIVDAIG